MKQMKNMKFEKKLIKNNLRTLYSTAKIHYGH